MIKGNSNNFRLSLLVIILMVSLGVFQKESFARDCSKLVPISNLPEHKNIKKLGDSCPGYDDFEPGIANFTLNGIKIDVPRRYIGLGFTKADGPATGVDIDMIYPEMKPQKSRLRGGEKNKVNIYIYKTRENFFNKNIMCHPDNSNWCFPIIQNSYRIHAVNHLPMKPEDFSEEHYINSLPKKEQIKYNKKLNLKYYTRPNGRKPATIYFRGDIVNPDYWLVCTAGCQAFLYLNNNKLYVGYSYMKHELLKHHDDVHKKILQKLNEFIKD